MTAPAKPCITSVSTAVSPFWTWHATLSRASTSELTYLSLVNAEGTDIGDAAFAVLGARLGILAAHAAVAAERAAWELEEWGARMAQIGREAMQEAA